MKTEKKKKIRPWLIAVIIVLILALIAGYIIYTNSRFVTTVYTLDSAKVDTGFRIVQISDLHQKSFGPNNSKLVQEVDRLKPDVIILSGDTIDSDKPDTSYAINLCRQLVRIAPVVYTYGNHENRYVFGTELNDGYLNHVLGNSGEDSNNLDSIEVKKDFRSELEAEGVTVLSNSAFKADINGNPVDIGAVSTNISSFWPYSGDFTHEFLTTDTNHFKLFVCHRPDVVTDYLQEYDIDLALSGHNHGGVIRLPDGRGLINANGGFFTDYPGGLYDIGNKTLIISRGFAGSGIIPRINNDPELVVIDVK